MAQNFIACDRGQVFLMPPSLTDWVPEDHLVWTVIGAVEQMNLDAFYGSYRANGQGKAAYDPQMMVTLLLYAYSLGNRSSRGIEKACRNDVAFKVITALRVPDHSTIAEFRRRHEQAIGELFTQVLGLCAEAGLVSVGMVAIDGTRIAANASAQRNVDYAGLAREILADADRIDREEDERFGDACGDELPAELQTAEGRRRALAEAKRRLAAKQAAIEPEPERIELRFDDQRVEEMRARGRRAWMVSARQQVEEHRRREGRPVPRDRSARLWDAERRMQQQLGAEIDVNDIYRQWRSGMTPWAPPKRGGGYPAPWQAPPEPEGRINVTDPDSRVMQILGGWMQGYNAQTAVNENQIVIAAEVSVSSPDFGQLEPMLGAAERELQKAGVTKAPDVVLADSGYWHQHQMERITSRGIPVLIPPDRATRNGERPGWSGGLYTFMRGALQSEVGSRLYRKRKTLIEPVFGDIKFNRRADRFLRRGRAAVQSEWRLITATNNLLKLHQHWVTA
jgi:transposase